MSTRETYVYQVAPIDFWDGTQSWSEYMQRRASKLLTSGESQEQAGEWLVAETKDEVDALRRAVDLVRQETAWEGDGDWTVSGAPREGRYELIYAVKQSNNGTTFIVSPIPLPGLSLVSEATVLKSQVYPGVPTREPAR